MGKELLKEIPTRTRVSPKMLFATTLIYLRRPIALSHPHTGRDRTDTKLVDLLSRFLTHFLKGTRFLLSGDGADFSHVHIVSEEKFSVYKVQ